MSGSVHRNHGFLFTCSLCVGNVPWKCKSVQCCTCYNGAFKLHFVSSSEFNSLSSSHSWSCPSLDHVEFPSPSTRLSRLFLVYPHCIIFSAVSCTYASAMPNSPPNFPLPMQLSLHPHLHTSYLLATLPLNPFFGFFPTLNLRLCFHALSFFPDSLRIFHWNSAGLRARTFELVYFLLLFPG